MKKDCAFQYAIAPRWLPIKIVEDTGLITLDEAKELWEKYLPDFIKNLRDENNPEMAIWVDMKEEGNYHKSLVYARSNAETDGHQIWENKRIYLKP